MTDERPQRFRELQLKRVIGANAIRTRLDALKPRLATLAGAVEREFDRASRPAGFSCESRAQASKGGFETPSRICRKVPPLAGEDEGDDGKPAKAAMARRRQRRADGRSNALRDGHKAILALVAGEDVD